MKAVVDSKAQVARVVDAKDKSPDAPPRRGTAAWSEEFVAATALAKKLSELPVEFLQCRGLRHGWNILIDFHLHDHFIQGTAGTLEQTLECFRCHMIRRDYYLTYKRSGVERLEKIDMKYERPPGYQMAGVPRGSKPQEVVLMAMYQRAMQVVAGADASDRETADA